MNLLIILFLWITSTSAEKEFSSANIYAGNNGVVHFYSNAQLEKIEATSNQLAGAVDIEEQEVYFSIRVLSFHGFNSGLQEEHFNENYLESEIFPHATFRGKIVEDIDVSRNGTYKVRCKGIFNIHGVEVERVLEGTIVMNGSTLKIESTFPIVLADYNISIPKIVEMKVAKEVIVSVKMDLTRKES